MANAYVVFDGAEPDSEVLGVADSLEAAMEVVTNRLYNENASVTVNAARLICNWSDEWRFEVNVRARGPEDIRAFVIRSHRIQS